MADSMDAPVITPAPAKTRFDQRPTAPGIEHVEPSLGGMTCHQCPPTIERALKAIDGVQWVQVNLAAATARVDYDPNGPRSPTS